jgi:putative DNA primase/helicase
VSTYGDYTAREGGSANGDHPYAAVPAELRELKQWVIWDWGIKHGGKRTKLPIEVATGELASTTNPATWGTFGQAVHAWKRGKHSGVGFVFSRGDPYAGVDLDHCRDPKTGEIAPWAWRFIKMLDGGYAEVSPSQTGVHVIVRGAIPPGGHRRPYEGGAVEMYDCSRFFTVTGQVLS